MEQKKTELNRQNEEVEIDLVELFHVLMHKIWILILAGILGAGLYGGYTMFFVSPTYTSTSEIYILSKSTSITSLTDLQVGTQLTKDYMEIIKSRPVLEKVIKDLHLDYGYGGLVGRLSFRNPQNTRILYITVTDTDAYMAKTIVDAITDASLDYMEEVMEQQAPNVIDYGHIAQVKSGPNVTRNGILGGMLAVFLVAAIIIFRYLRDDSLRNSEDVERYLGLEVLGQIPLTGGVSKKKTHGKDKDAKKAAEVQL